MKTTPEFTDAEIQNAMDFKHVLALTEAARLRTRKIVRRIVTTVLIAGLVGGAFLIYRQYSMPQSPLPSQPTLSNGPSPVIPQDTTKQPAGPALSIDSKKESTQKEPVIAKKKEKVSTIRVDSAKSVFLPAEPTKGYPALYDYFAKELRYPQTAIKDSIQGVISVSFVINVQGKPEQVTTDHVLGEAFDREAIRLIESMPAWKPAQLDGAPVNSKVSVPITFSVKTIRQQ